MSDWLEAERRVERAQQLSEAQRWEEALSELDAALAINPNHAAWLAHKAYLLDELERHEEAVECLERAIELDTPDRDWLLALGVNLARLGRYARALTVFDDLARQNPDFEPAYCHRIRIYAQLGQHDQAEEMFYLAQQLDDQCPHCFFGIAHSLAERGRIDQALYCWQRVLELEPEYLGVRERIAHCYRLQGKLDEARELYLEELRSDPGNTDLLMQLAELCLQTNDADAAAAKLEQILELVPDHPGAQLALGKIRVLQGKPETGLEHLDEAARLGAEDADTCSWAGEALLRMGKFPEARRKLERAVELQPASPRSLYLLAHALLASNKPAMAADHYRRLLAQDAENPLVHHHLSLCLYQTTEYEGSLWHALEALRLSPEFVPAMQHATYAYIRLGRWRDARGMIRRALDKDPGNEAILAVRKRIWRIRLFRAFRRLLGLLH